MLNAGLFALRKRSHRIGIPKSCLDYELPRMGALIYVSLPEFRAIMNAINGKMSGSRYLRRTF